MANLVENEVNPTSMHSMPINDDMLPNMDSDTLGNLTPFNNVKGSFDNLKGSYNNLFCDNLDDEPGQTLSLEHTDPTNVQQMTSQLLENVYCNVSPTMVRQKLPATASATLMAKESPQFNAHTMSTNRIVDNLLTASDPNLHVYSNIGNATINETNPMMSTTNSKTKVNDVLATMSNATLPLKSKSTPITAATTATAAAAAATTTPATVTIKDNPTIESIISQSILNKSSKLLSDNLNDLDLDDPTLVSGSIVNTPIAAVTISTMSKVLKNNNSDSIGGSGGGGGAFSHNKYSSSKKSRQSLNVDDSRSNIAKKLFNDSTTTTTSGMDAIGENGNGSYLRSLHDTTMIDTALDLDSIEDTTIGIQNVG